LSLSIEPCESDYSQALLCLQQGGIVAYPTETFYGLAVDPKQEQAIASLYDLKRRIEGKALSLLVPDLSILRGLVSSIPAPYEQLISSFWPGPLTLIFPAASTVSPAITGGSATVAVRISSHPVAQKLCELFGRALTATSANLSGVEALVNAAAVKDLWGNAIGYVLDGGETPGGLGSTLLECIPHKQDCRIIREGVIPIAEIRKLVSLQDTVCNN